MQPGTHVRQEQVQRWVIDLSSAEVCWQDFLRLLSEPERERAARYRFRPHAARFVVVRAALRVLLATALGLSAREVQIAYGALGKPLLVSAHLHFSVSHSGACGAIAITPNASVGIDVEGAALDVGAANAIACLYFSGREREALLEIPEERRAAAFLRCWTRKEAYVKATGEGLHRGLDTFSVSIGDDCRLVEVDGDPARALGWSLVDLQLPSGVAGALACESDAVDLCVHHIQAEVLLEAYVGVPIRMWSP